MSIYKNSLIEWQGDGQTRLLERVLLFDDTGQSVLLINVFAKSGFPFWRTRKEIIEALEQKEATVITKDPYSYLHIPESLLSAEAIQHREERWALIESLTERVADFADEALRASIIPQLSKETGVGKEFLYRLFRKYLQRGQVKNALLRDYSSCGRKGKAKPAGTKKRGRPRKFSKSVGINITEDLQTIIAQSMALFYETPLERTFQRAYEFMLARHFAEDFIYEKGVPLPILLPEDELPTVRQARYWYKKTSDPVRAMQLRKGMRLFNLKYRALHGRAADMADHPYGLVILDTTKADVYIRSSIDDSVILEKLTYGIAFDVYMEAIVGIVVTHENASHLADAQLLANVYENKVEFCAMYGVPITDEDWPHYGFLPIAVIADRGSLAGWMVSNIINNLDIDILTTDSYRADLKGLGENQFHLTNTDVLHMLPGAVRRTKMRGDKDPALDAALSINEVTALLIRRAIHWNKTHRKSFLTLDADVILDHVDPTPNNLWHWSKENKPSGFIYKEPDIVRLNLLPDGAATVTERGLRFDGRFYICDTAMRERWLEKSRMGRKFEPVKIAYDPRCLDVVYMILDGGAELERCVLVDWLRKYADKTVLEFDSFIEKQKRLEAARKYEELQSQVQLNAHVEHTSQTAIKRVQKHKAAGVSIRKQRRDMKDNTRYERERRGHDEAWSSLGTTDRESADTANVDILSGYVPDEDVHGPEIEYIPADDDYDDMEARRMERHKQ